MNKLQLFIVLIIFGSVICQNADQAGSILTELVKESQENLKQFDDNWGQTQPVIKRVLDEIYGEFLTLEQECKDRQASISTTQQDIENCHHYIEWIEEKVAENNRKIEALGDAHCSSTQLYINGLKHNKIALSLIAFLRQAIENRDSLSFVQRRSILSKLTVFFQTYKINEIEGLQFLQQDVNVDDYKVDTNEDVKERTSDEIGNKHIDNNREEITVDQMNEGERRDWPTYKAELLQVLDTLEKNISEKMGNAQDEQINSGISLAEFKIQIEAENNALNRHQQDEVDKIARYEDKTVRQNASYRECMDELNIVFETLLTTRADYDSKVEQHDDRRKALKEELDLFVYVEKQYEQNVNVDDSYQSREVDAFSLD